METRAAQPAKEKGASSAALSGAEGRAAQKPGPLSPTARGRKVAGYGLPCARCRTYYASDLEACPNCKSHERVSSAAATAPPVAPLDSQPDSALPTEDERERFLKELKSHVFASHTQINTAATFRCVLEHQHKGNSEPAAVCHSCYGDLRQQADRMEAALRIDTKEAAQIVYSAVWADPSDPTRTYENAAAALLAELRKRAGIGLLLGSHQPRPH